MGVSRRRIVRGAGALAAAAALAGCTGGGEPTATEQPGIEAFRTRIRSELDITIDRLVEEDGRAVLVYTSTQPTESDRWGYEVGFISGRFARLVHSGWAVEGLTGTVTGRDGRTMTWRLEAETARQFIDDEITADEFIDAIFGSMEEQ